MKKVFLLLVILAACDINQRIDNHQLAKCSRACGGVEKIDFLSKVGAAPWICTCSDGITLRIEY